MREDNLSGVWMQIKSPNFYGDVMFLKFVGTQGIPFKAETEKEGILTLKEIDFPEDISDGNFEMVSDTRLKIFKKGLKSSFYYDKKVTEEYEYADDYIQLQPTETTLSNDEIQELQFTVKWKNETLKVIFNIILDLSFIQEVNMRLNRTGRKILLEKFESTLFLSFFDNDKREKLIPIKEIDTEKIILTGFPEEPYEVTGEQTKLK